MKNKFITLLSVACALAASEASAFEKLFSVPFPATSKKILQVNDYYSSNSYVWIDRVQAPSGETNIILSFEQSGPTSSTPSDSQNPNSYPSYDDYIYETTSQIFAKSGTLIQDLKGPYEDTLSDGSILKTEEILTSSGGSTGLSNMIVLSPKNGTWTETQRIVINSDSMDSTGTNSGNGSFVVIKRVKDGVAYADVYCADAAALAPTPAITSDLTEAVSKKGKATSYTTTTNFGADAFIAVGLPAGMGINASTGVISGKPKTKGSFAVMIFASKKGGGATTSDVKVFTVN